MSMPQQNTRSKVNRVLKIICYTLSFRVKVITVWALPHQQYRFLHCFVPVRMLFSKTPLGTEQLHQHPGNNTQI